MDATSTMLKVAYLKGLEQSAEKHASDLGLETEMVKEALLEKLLGGALKWGVGKPVAAVGKTLLGQGARAGSYLGGKALGVLPGVGREAWRFGKNLVGAGMKTPGEMSGLYKALTFGGRNVPSQMLQYGTISGALGGLTGGQPGEGWSWSGAGKGFLGGAAGGLGWAAGGRLAKAGLGKMMATKPFQSGRLAAFAQRAKNVTGIGAKQPSFWGQRVWDTGKAGKSFGQIWKGTPTGGAGQSVLRGLGSKAKDIGIKAGLGIPVVGGALAASIGAEEGARQLMGDDQSAVSPQSMAARGAYAMTPQGRMAVGYY